MSFRGTASRCVTKKSFLIVSIVRAWTDPDHDRVDFSRCIGTSWFSAINERDQLGYDGKEPVREDEEQTVSFACTGRDIKLLSERRINPRDVTARAIQNRLDIPNVRPNDWPAAIALCPN